MIHISLPYHSLPFLTPGRAIEAACMHRRVVSYKVVGRSAQNKQKCESSQIALLLATQLDRLDGVSSAAIRVLRGLDITSVGSFLGSLRTVLLGDGAVLEFGPHPLADVTVKLAARDSALATVDLALDAHALEGAILEGFGGRSSGPVVDEGTSEPPGPLEIIGSAAT